ncbi:hypothetical protein [Ruania zhangjianzhongii]|uniref:hypothetical protein n=1 Tax=Ruania zhangjianzhongii TaxID=2603206 RepID=UPI0011D20B29|nr:hypothetical protein [Ruania zhangjianzhongii]
MLPFSPGPVPTTDAELSQRLTEGLVQLLRPRAAAGVAVSASGATAEHIDAVSIDLSGAEIDPIPSEIPAAGGTPVTVDQVSVLADPLTAGGVRAQVRGELRRVPAAWVSDGAGILWLVPQPGGGAGGGPDGEVSVAAQIADLEAGVLAIGGPMLAERGFTLTGVQLQVEAAGTSRAEVRVRASVRRGILSATVEGRGTATVDEALVLTLTDLSVSSANRLVSMGLAMVARHLQAWEGRRIELGGYLVGGCGSTRSQCAVPAGRWRSAPR